MRRRRTKHSQADEQKAKERAILVQAEEHLKQTIEKELSFAKSNSLALPSKDSSGKKRGEKSEFPLLQQSGIYQLDLSNVRNEIPPVNYAPRPPRGEATSARTYKSRQYELKGSRQRDTASGNAMGRLSKQKWRDDCDCLRCTMMRRQYNDGDVNAYKNWGNYPCIKLGKYRPESDYDSD